MVITGNTAKLPGLQAFIGKKIDVAVIEMNAFKRLKGSTVTASPTFKNNMLSFANCYGLCLQSLGIAQLQTNLLPREILFDRLVDSKKPWVISAIALLLLSFSFNYFMQYGAWKKVAHDSTGASTATSGPDGWESKIIKAESVSSKSDANIKDYEALQKAYENLYSLPKQSSSSKNIDSFPYFENKLFLVVLVVILKSYGKNMKPTLDFPKTKFVYLNHPA